MFRTVLTAFVLFASAASAQDFPNKTIRIVVGFPAGGPSDVPARILAEKLRVLGQPVIVENKTGAAGMIALSPASAGAMLGDGAAASGFAPGATKRWIGASAGAAIGAAGRDSPAGAGTFSIASAVETAPAACSGASGPAALRSGASICGALTGRPRNAADCECGAAADSAAAARGA